MSNRHTVESHHWFRGSLEIRRYEFETLDSAHDFRRSCVCDYIKIFDPDGNLVHSDNGFNPDYA